MAATILRRGVCVQRILLCNTPLCQKQTTFRHSSTVSVSEGQTNKISPLEPVQIDKSYLEHVYKECMGFKKTTAKQEIFVMNEFKNVSYSVEECIEMHKEAAQPAMTNSLHALVYADILLNMIVNKKTNLKDIGGFLRYPHPFEVKQKVNVIMFSENQQDVEMAKQLGAVLAGGEESVARFTQGEYRKKDIDKIDVIVATPKMAVLLIPHRPLLREKLPTAKNGCVIEKDMGNILKAFFSDVLYKSVGPDSKHYNKTQIPFGQLRQETSKLKENFKYLVDTLSALKPKTAEPLVQGVQFIAPPSSETFKVDKKDFMTRVVKRKPEKDVQDKKKASAESDDDSDEEK